MINCTDYPSPPLRCSRPPPSPDPKPASSLKIYLRLLGYLKPLLGLFGISLVGYIIFASSQPMLAAILKYFVDGLGTPGTTRYELPCSAISN